MVGSKHTADIYISLRFGAKKQPILSHNSRNIGKPRDKPARATRQIPNKPLAPISHNLAGVKLMHSIPIVAEDCKFVQKVMRRKYKNAKIGAKTAYHRQFGWHHGHAGLPGIRKCEEKQDQLGQHKGGCFRWRECWAGEETVYEIVGAIPAHPV